MSVTCEPSTVIHPLDDPLDTAPCGYLSFTDDGTIERINRTFSDLLEYEPAEIEGHKIDNLLPIASRIFYQTHFFPLLKMQGKVTEIYFSVRTKSRIDIPMLVNAVRRQKKEIFVNDCILIPIHQRIRYEDEILHAQKAAEAARLAREQAEIALRQQYERALILGQIIDRIRRSLDLTTIFETTVREIRQYFQADRVGIFRFHPDSDFSSGEFIAESVSGEFIPAMGAIVPEHCFATKHALKYRRGRIQAIADIDRSALPDCYRELLRQFQIKANLVVPLLKEGELWGLLCAHQCSEPRDWQDFEIEFIRQVADQFAIAIQQADLVERLRWELEERKRAESELKKTNEELSRATRQLEQLVNTDGLTGIANRRYFDERLQQEWRRLCRTRQPLSLLLLDVDYFKAYNDTYGHQAGDRCLIEVALAASDQIRRPADLVARYGGEEFAVILPETDSRGAIDTAERVHQAIRALNIAHETSGVSDRVTISVGIATMIPRPEMLPDVLVDRADRALYRAKETGRDQSAFFSSS